MDVDTNPELVPSTTSHEPQVEQSDPAVQPQPVSQDPSESTESTVVEATHPAEDGNEEHLQQAPYPAELTSSSQSYFPAEDDPNSSRFSSPTMSHQQTSQQSSSRPGSGVSSGGERYGYPSSQPDQSQKQASQPSKNSVVIKVGMVGDAQIGKTSLMVKYVEGSWDEDYIQTLGGMNFLRRSHRCLSYLLIHLRHRSQLYGEDYLNPKHRDHLFDLGSWRPARIRQHASTSLQ